MASNALPPALSSMSVSLPEQQVLQAICTDYTHIVGKVFSTN
jgi:hypothetical protein